MLKFLMMTFILIGQLTLATEEQTQVKVAFNPPPGWRMADTSVLPPHVKILIVGKGKHEMPPSLNLGYEPFTGTLSDYLQIVKKFNRSQGDPWSDLGMIETQAGPASLSQVEIRTQWGHLREMHLIFLHKGVIYILTAAALKEEFSNFYPLFFDAFRSLRLVN